MWQLKRFRIGAYILHDHNEVGRISQRTDLTTSLSAYTPHLQEVFSRVGWPVMLSPCISHGGLVVGPQD